MAGDEWKKEKDEKKEYAVNQLVQSAYGYSDEQLLEQMQLAETDISDEQIPSESTKDLKRLLAEIERRNITPHFEGADDKTAAEIAAGGEEKPERKITRLGGHFIRVMIAAAILCSVLVMTGITAGAKRSYEYRVRSRVEIKPDVVLSNSEVNEYDDALDLAYIEIHKNIGINVLRIGYRPKQLKYEKVVINDQKATIYFKYNEHPFSIVQQIRTDDSSAIIVSDREEVDTVYNEWLKKQIIVEKSEVNSNEIEYSAKIVDNDVYYYLAGIMKEQEFIKIIENIHLSE